MEPIPERFFNNEVLDEAVHHGWRPFHVDGFRVARGRGFPDIVMFRKDEVTGGIDMLVAELKKSVESEVRKEQSEWLEAFEQIGITTRVWRSDSVDDRAELGNIIQNGTTGIVSPTPATQDKRKSSIPRNFQLVMTNTIETIEGNELRTGDKASLRRMNPANPDRPMFWRIMSQKGIPRNADVQKWGVIINGIALMAHHSRAHRETTPVGKALFDVVDNENRLSMLLAARGTILHSILTRLFRRLATAGQPFDWLEMAWFILNEGLNEKEADISRMKIARAYYRAERRSAATCEPQNS